MEQKELSDKINELISTSGFGIGASLVDFLLFSPKVIQDYLKLDAQNIDDLSQRREMIIRTYEGIIPKLGKISGVISATGPGFPSREKLQGFIHSAYKGDVSGLFQFEDVRRWLSKAWDGQTRKNKVTVLKGKKDIPDFEVSAETIANLHSRRKMNPNHYRIFWKSSRNYFEGIRQKPISSSVDKYSVGFNNELKLRLYNRVVSELGINSECLSVKDMIQVNQEMSKSYDSLRADITKEMLIEIGNLVSRSMEDFYSYWDGFYGQHQQYGIDFSEGINKLVMMGDPLGFRVTDLNYVRGEENKVRLRELGPNLNVDPFVVVGDRYDNHQKRREEFRPAGIHHTVYLKGQEGFPIELQIYGLVDQVMDMFGRHAHGLYEIRGKKTMENIKGRKNN